MPACPHPHIPTYSSLQHVQHGSGLPVGSSSQRLECLSGSSSSSNRSSVSNNMSSSSGCRDSHPKPRPRTCVPCVRPHAAVTPLSPGRISTLSGPSCSPSSITDSDTRSCKASQKGRGGRGHPHES